MILTYSDLCKLDNEGILVIAFIASMRCGGNVKQGGQCPFTLGSAGLNPTTKALKFALLTTLSPTENDHNDQHFRIQL